MPRKAKGTELNQEQILEMQALFEGSDYGSVKIAEIINERHKIAITEGAVRHYAKKEGWLKGKKKEYYNAKKIAKIQELTAMAKQDDEEYKLITKISKQAEKEGEKIAEIKINKELEMQKAEYLGIQLRNAVIEEVMNVFKNASDNSAIVENFQYDANGKLSVKETASKDSKSKILRDLNIIELMKGLGALQTQPTALIQNNNIGSQPPTQNIPLEVATQEETVEVRKELLKQLK
jgi:hypothetical protein